MSLARWLAAGGAALSLLACAGAGRPDARESPVVLAERGPAPSPVAGEETCAGCHAREATEHAASGHAGAFTSPLFLREWGGRSGVFCLGCHAPRAAELETALVARASTQDELHEYEGPSAEEEAHLARLRESGVDCESCHVVDGAVRAVRVSGQAPHRSVVDPGLARVDACERCHQVDFPEIPGEALQDTVHEWREAGEPAGACQPCHVPLDEGRHRHDLPGGRDPALLRRSLAIEARAEPDGWNTRVVLTLTAREPGHAIPTGDVFRRLAVRAASEDGSGRTAEVELGRHFVSRGGLPRVELRDDRVPARAPREVRLRVEGRPPRIRWSVAMRSVEGARFEEVGLPVEALERLVAEGTIAGVP